MQYSRLPRALRTTALSAQAASQAEYLAAWVERVEAVGNRHYPSEARQRKLFGELQLAVTLLPDGSIAGIDILRSSDHPLLDYAARDTLLRALPGRNDCTLEPFRDHSHLAVHTRQSAQYPAITE